MKNLERIAGYSKEKQELEQLRKFLINIDSYRASGVRIPRGVLLYGEPGVGKTVMARSIAGENINLVEVRAADCCDDDTVEKIQNAFEVAKSCTPSVLLLDELDKIAGTSFNLFMEGNDNTKKILLQELDKLVDNDGVLVVATCNELDVLGDALIRSGRFDRIVHVEVPTEQERVLILNKYFGKLKLKNTASISRIARITAGYTGAQLECIVNEAGIVAMDSKKQKITMSIVEQVINQMEFHGKVKEDDFDKEQVAIHEAGHALVALILCPDNIYSASILSQGNSAGHVQMTEPYRITTVNDAEDMIAITLAGRVAERIILDKCYLGSGSDLRSAYLRVVELLVRHGAYGYKYLNMDRRENLMRMEKNDMITSKVAEVLDAIDKKVTNILSLNKALLEEIAKTLQKKKVLDREQLLAFTSKIDRGYDVA